MTPSEPDKSGKLYRDPARDEYPPELTIKRILLRLVTERAFRLTPLSSEDGANWIDYLVRAALDTDNLPNVKTPLGALLTEAYEAMSANLAKAADAGASTAIQDALKLGLEHWREQVATLGIVIPSDQDMAPAPAFRPFGELFDFAAAVTEAAYRQHAHGFKAAPRVALRFTANEAKENELGANTKFPSADNERERQAHITLNLPVEKFHLSDYLICLYVLFHEIFVHAVQNLHLPADRRPHGELSAFSEGFVDSMAIRVLRRALARKNGFPESHLRYQRYIVDYSQRSHDSRSDRREAERLENIPQNKTRRYAIELRARGRETLERLEALRDQKGAGQFADLAKLVLSLNTLAWTVDQRRTFMCELTDALDGIETAQRGGLPASPTQIERLAALRRFAETGDEAVLRGAFHLDSP